MNNDTIASISTALSESGIGIIRISGPDAITIADQIYTDKEGTHSLKSQKSHTIHYGFIVNSSGEIIDEVMVSVMKAPNSYTKENVVEINCHGGIRVCRNILDTVLNTGARLADPGEFTKRAFLNGRLDLTRAEAVMDTIRATSDTALDQSIRQLRGELYTVLNNICSDILYEIAHIEAVLDDPDSYDISDYSDELSEKIDHISSDISTLIRSYDEGRILSEGIRTSILGNPNAGKSSLMNLLYGENRAIVTDIPGTTRDTLTETIRLGDATIVLTDTAGIRETDDKIEQIGVNRAIDSARESDLIIYVADISDAESTSPVVDPVDDTLVDLLKSTKLILLLNKCDLAQTGSHDDHTEEVIHSFTDRGITPDRILSTSMITHEGISELKSVIREMFYSGELTDDHQIMITNLRHVECLKEAQASLNKVKESIASGVSEDLYCIDLTDAYRSLARITGAEVTEDIVNEIFSRFCMGK